MAKACGLCNDKIGLLGGINIKDACICKNCFNKSLNVPNVNCLTVNDFKERFLYLEQNNELFNSFSPTVKIGEYIEVDENKQYFRVGKSKECFPFSCFVNFELNEDGDVVTKGGLGSAAVGGVLFGGVGAIVGGIAGSKKSKTVVNRMYIRISLNSKWIKSLQINLLSTETKKGGFVYNTTKQLADRIVSTLEGIASVRDANTPCSPQPISQLSPADEILKYKQLLDIGVITEDEFTQKKNQLLGL